MLEALVCFQLSSGQPLQVGARIVQHSVVCRWLPGLQLFLIVDGGAGADLEAAATWVHVFGTLEPRNVPTEIQLDSSDMSQRPTRTPLGRLWTVQVAP